jgi:hypothetical protein
MGQGRLVAQTACDIVDEVNRKLTESAGRAQVQRLTALFNRLHARRQELRAQVRRLGKRPGVSFYAGVDRFGGTTLRVDVRVAGMACGVIKLGPERPERHFTPQNLEHLFDGKRAEWREPRVRRYLEQVKDYVAGRHRESEVEAALLVEMSRSEAATKPRLLLQHQPVKLAGLPFQFPLPVVARSLVELVTSIPGHIDVLARAGHGGGWLRVFEVKKESAPDVAHALDQAITYCAALEHLLLTHPTTYWAALGYSAPRPTVNIAPVAFAHDSPRVRTTIAAAAARLAQGGSPYPLFAQFFQWTNGQRRLEVTHEQQYA